MLLKNLINNIPEKLNKIKITGLSTNSKKVRPGNIFFAIKGKIEMGKNLLKKQLLRVHL